MALEEQLEANLHSLSPISRVPQEIVDQFIDALDSPFYDHALKIRENESRDKDIKTCMQVSRAFRSRARTLLFSEIVISLQERPTESKATENLQEILENDEALAHQVHTVLIQLHMEPFELLHLHFRKTTFHDRSLCHILGILPFLQTLGLAAIDGGYGWQNLSMDIKNAIFRLHDVPSVTTLKLFGHRLKIPVEVVIRWSNLKNLSVQGSPLECRPLRQSYVPARIAGRRIARLESMESVTFPGTAVEIFVKAGGETLFGKLKNLLVVVSGERDWDVSRMILMRVRHSLETFDLANLFSGNRMFAQPDLSHFESSFLVLHTLILREDNLKLGESAADIATLLCAFASAPTIHTMSIRIQWNTPVETSEWTPGNDELIKTKLLDNIKPEEWAALDATLAHAPLFRVLDIDVRFWTDNPVWRTTWGIEAAVSRQWTPQLIFPLLSHLDTPPTIRLAFSQLDQLE